MKRITCEMCGSNDLVKHDGAFECQSCGIRYSVEEARKMMIEGTVDVSGSTVKVEGSVDVSGSSVKVDNTARLENVYKVARRERDDGNFEKAAKHYEEVLLDNPDDWEAVFYSAFCSSVNSYRKDEIGEAIKLLQNCIDNTFVLIKKHSNGKEQKDAAEEVSRNVSKCCEYFHKDAEEHLEKIKRDFAKTEYSAYNSEVLDNTWKRRGVINEAVSKMLASVGFNLIELFGENSELGKEGSELIDRGSNLLLYTIDYLTDSQVDEMRESIEIRKAHAIGGEEKVRKLISKKNAEKTAMEASKRNTMITLIRVFGIIGLAGGIIGGIAMAQDMATPWSSQGEIVFVVILFSILGLLIGLAIPSYPTTIKWTWNKVKDWADNVTGFINKLFNIDEFLSWIFTVFFVAGVSYNICIIGSSIVSIYRYVTYRK